MALYSRGVAKGQSGDAAGEIADYTLVVEVPGASAETKAKALLSRALAREDSGDNARAIADYKLVVGMPDAPAELKKVAAKALRDIQAGSQDTDSTGE